MATEAGNDFFDARYYQNRLGRFMSPDEFSGGPVVAYGPPDPTPPGPLPYADILNPQSLNKYAYVYNNPLRYVDPTGRVCWKAIHGGKCADDPPPPPPPKAEIPPAPFVRPNPVFSTADEAGKVAAQTALSKSEKRKVEYGGRVFRIGIRLYTYSDPVTQNQKYTVDPDDRTGIPRIVPGSTKAGTYHTHVKDSDYLWDRLSWADYGYARKEGVPIYVGIPGGSVLKYDPQTNQQGWLVWTEE